MAKLYVSNKDESVRLFKSDAMEFFTKVHYSVPLVIYIPVISYALYLSVQSPLIGWLNGAFTFVGGIVIWTLTEYVLHRYVFHYHPSSSLGKRIHFLMHGVHHDYPNDSKRLVLPPSMSIPLAILFYFLFKAIIPGDYLFPFYAGFVFGYLVYDMIHYAVHHANFTNKYWIALKTHHLKHHFKDPDKGFGVSSQVWDVIIGSNFTTKSSASNHQNKQKNQPVTSK